MRRLHITKFSKVVQWCCTNPNKKTQTDKHFHQTEKSPKLLLAVDVKTSHRVNSLPTPFSSSLSSSRRLFHIGDKHFLLPSALVWRTATKSPANVLRLICYESNRFIKSNPKSEAHIEIIYDNTETFGNLEGCYCQKLSRFITSSLSLFIKKITL